MNSKSSEDRRDYSKSQAIFLVLTGIILLVIGHSYFEERELDYHLNLLTETIGVGASVLITVGFLDRRNERRESQRRQQDLIRDLAQRSGSQVNQTAVSAIEQLHRLDRLQGVDGVLKGADLHKAVLRGRLDLDKVNIRSKQSKLRQVRRRNDDLSEFIVTKTYHAMPTPIPPPKTLQSTAATDHAHWQNSQVAGGERVNPCKYNLASDLSPSVAKSLCDLRDFVPFVIKKRPAHARPAQIN